MQICLAYFDVDGDRLQCRHSIKLKNVVNAKSVASAIYDGIE